MDVPDYVTQQLAVDFACAQEDADAQRSLAHAALDLLHQQSLEMLAMQRTIDALRAELRRYVVGRIGPDVTVTGVVKES